MAEVLERVVAVHQPLLEPSQFRRSPSRRQGQLMPAKGLEENALLPKWQLEGNHLSCRRIGTSQTADHVSQVPLKPGEIDDRTAKFTRHGRGHRAPPDVRPTPGISCEA